MTKIQELISSQMKNGQTVADNNTLALFQNVIEKITYWKGQNHI